jgi:hypothetical protein
VALVGEDELFWPEVRVDEGLELPTVVLVSFQSGTCELKKGER